MKNKYLVIEGDYKISETVLNHCPECGSTILILEEGEKCLCHMCKHIGSKEAFSVHVSGFAFNESGVCVNPEIVFKTECCSIEIATDGKKWDVGFTYFLGGSPVSLNMCRFSRKEAILEGIGIMKRHLIAAVDSTDSVNYPKQKREQARKALNQLKRFSNSLCIEFNENLKVEVTQENKQLSLF